MVWDYNIGKLITKEKLKEGALMTTVYYCTWDSPMGQLYLGATDRGLCKIDFGSEGIEGFLRWFDKKISNAKLIEDNERLFSYINELKEYFQGDRKQFTMDLDLIGTDFQQKVWRALQNVDYGKTSSYKDIACSIQNPKALRAVGGANNKNPLPIVVPCHRIIGQDGSLVGYGGGLDYKKYLLRLEGIKI
jgi:methylated-DNA-[protein]-cysteine S-methyltransferase